MAAEQGDAPLPSGREHETNMINSTDVMPDNATVPPAKTLLAEVAPVASPSELLQGSAVDAGDALPNALAKLKEGRKSAPPAAQENVVANSKKERPDVGTLAYTEWDIVRFLASLPVPLDRVMPGVLVRMVARILFMHKLLATDMAYDVLLTFWRGVVDIFFREVQPRSSYRIPHKGPLIFVAAPHHNQFLDPLLLASEVRRGSGRRVSFLIAQKSLQRQFIGTIARLFQSIPVSRAADSAKPGKGFVTMGDDPTHLRGVGTEFTKQLQVHGQIVLDKETEYAAAEVVDILSDTEVRIKKEFAGKNVDKALRGQLGSSKNPGAKFKCFPYVDQKQMYAKVYECLSDGKCLGIFPEGGSHDRTDLLPLKAGVVIMALGAMANDPNLDVKIVPVGMSYFHPHKFRSRAVVEFGKPLSVPSDQVALFKQGGDGKRRAVSQMLDLVYDGLKSVTVRAPDYETLMVIQAGRRLIKMPGQQLTLGDTVELNRKFIMGYLKHKDHPKVVEVRDAVLTYNEHLKQLGLRDHHVDRANRSRLRSTALLLYRLSMLLLWSGCALPGAILNAPIILLAKIVSKRKAKEALAASQVKVYGRDVLATWKVLVSLGVAPVLYGTYTALATIYVRRHTNWSRTNNRLIPLYSMIALLSISYSALKFGEVGIDVYKSLPPLFFSLLGRRKVIERLQEERMRLAAMLHRTIEELGPYGWDDEDMFRSLPSARAPPSPSEEMYWRTNGVPLHGALSHPLTFIDEWVFGWGASRRSQRAPSSPEMPVMPDRNAVPDEDEMGPDYEEALSVYRRKADDAGALHPAGPHRPRVRRRSSHDYRLRHPTGSPRMDDVSFTPLK
ncbi:uncharacterized protein MJAP1_003889 [Malassezia japonica]|uniref:Phospholipid/glycerol acyltransferase domain-containing protein n=1 Tax=Malassezia japonica TaxID=223818 RepID=A0AAF0F9K7_9BASI|nr:uncharacterized protein MJAP1_003889 [Malassezia japonica]WFD40898.1 hypothetical protein MJAP1_003889 [Malassezia japonica]